MKTKTKIISMALAMVLMLSAFSTLTPLVASAAEAISNNYELELSLENSEECVEFIEENFSQVISEYNIAHSEEDVLCAATSIEGSTQIYITDLGKYGIYLDFDNDNGYLLVTENYHLYEFEPVGDLSYLKNVDFAYYSSFDGFMYLDSATGVLERYDYVDKSNELFGSGDLISGSVAEENELTGAHGHDTNGHIYNIDEYVAYYYPEYEYVGRYMSTAYQWVYQSDTSVYNHLTSEGNFTEGNCVINATYSMMNDWYRRNRFSWLPSGTVNFNSSLTSDPLYSRYGTNTYDGWYARGSSALSAMPSLYMELRSYAITYGYLPDQGMQASYIIDMVERVGSTRGYTLNMLKSSSFNDDIKYALNTNQACVLVVAGSNVYGNHAMGLYGYVEYEHTTGWWIFSKTETKYFYVVDDGHSYKRGDSNYTYNFVGVNTPVCYFDPHTSDEPTVSFYYLED